MATNKACGILNFERPSWTVKCTVNPIPTRPAMHPAMRLVTSDRNWATVLPLAGLLRFLGQTSFSVGLEVEFLRVALALENIAWDDPRSVMRTSNMKCEVSRKVNRRVKRNMTK